MNKDEIIRDFVQAIKPRPFSFEDLKFNAQAVVTHLNNRLGSNIELDTDGDIAPSGESFSYLQFSDDIRMFAEISLKDEHQEYSVITYPTYKSEEYPEAQYGEVFDPSDSAYLARIIYSLLPQDYKNKLDTLKPEEP